MLRLLALVLTNRQVAERLVISVKIGVSTRGAAALFAVEHGILAAGS